MREETIDVEWPASKYSHAYRFSKEEAEIALRDDAFSGKFKEKLREAYNAKWTEPDSYEEWKAKTKIPDSFGDAAPTTERFERLVLNLEGLLDAAREVEHYMNSRGDAGDWKPWEALRSAIQACGIPTKEVD